MMTMMAVYIFHQQQHGHNLGDNCEDVDNDGTLDWHDADVIFNDGKNGDDGSNCSGVNDGNDDNDDRNGHRSSTSSAWCY